MHILKVIGYFQSLQERGELKIMFCDFGAGFKCFWSYLMLLVPLCISFHAFHMAVKALSCLPAVF